MSEPGYPRRVLSEAVIEAVRGRTVRAAVFTTFTFEPDFFEREVVPLLFDRAFSHAGKFRLVQLEDSMRSVGHAAVYYDRRGLKNASDSAALDIDRIPLARKGYFHPKLALLLVEDDGDGDTDAEDADPVQSLIVGVLSANLTERGWWHAVECAWIGEVAAGERCSFRRDLLGLMRRIRRDERTGDKHVALETIRRFVVHKTADESRRSRDGVLHPRLFCGQKPLAEWLAETLRLPVDTFNLEIISPFFDRDGRASTVRALIDQLHPRETRIYLPEADDGAALCSPAFCAAVAALPGVHWARLTGTLRRRGKTKDDRQTPRFVHAKVYRLWSRSEGKEYVLVGSANLTGPGHSRAGSGNLEAAVLYQSPRPRGLRFWLQPLAGPPTRFRDDPPSEDAAIRREVAPITVRYHWDRERASYFWDGDAGALPAVVELRASGTLVAVIAPPVPGEWVELSDEAGRTLATLLRSTSFVEVAVDGRARGTILVREQDMALKPSILLSLTPEEILRYWSLLSDTQRDAFLEDKVHDELVLRGLAAPRDARPDSTDSLFDRFAGIFHAFHQLGAHVRSALERGELKIAVYRLFGRKYDSLPRLLETVFDNPRSDPVNAYVTLLTARQLVADLRREFPEFFAAHAEQCAVLEALLLRTEKVRDRLDVGPDARKFFRWYERMFLAQARRPEAEAEG